MSEDKVPLMKTDGVNEERSETILSPESWTFFVKEFVAKKTGSSQSPLQPKVRHVPSDPPPVTDDLFVGPFCNDIAENVVNPIAKEEDSRPRTDKGLARKRLCDAKCQRRIFLRKPFITPEARGMEEFMLTLTPRKYLSVMLIQVLIDMTNVKYLAQSARAQESFEVSQRNFEALLNKEGVPLSPKIKQLLESVYKGAFRQAVMREIYKQYFKKDYRLSFSELRSRNSRLENTVEALTAQSKDLQEIINKQQSTLKEQVSTYEAIKEKKAEIFKLFKEVNERTLQKDNLAKNKRNEKFNYPLRGDRKIAKDTESIVQFMGAEKTSESPTRPATIVGSTINRQKKNTSSSMKGSPSSPSSAKPSSPSPSSAKPSSPSPSSAKPSSPSPHPLLNEKEFPPLQSK